MKNKWETISSDIDEKKLVRRIKGRITKARYRAIARWARVNSFRSKRCYHDYDCCGCHVSTYVIPEVTKDGVTLTMTATFNY